MLTPPQKPILLSHVETAAGKIQRAKVRKQWRAYLLAGGSASAVKTRLTQYPIGTAEKAGILLACKDVGMEVA